MREDDFLRAVLADPKDDALLKVYSDWLEERGDPTSDAKAKFLRLTAESGEDTLHDALLRKLAADLDTGWLAVVSRMKIENCKGKRDAESSRYLSFRLVCDLKWEDLRVTGENAVRTCERCKEDVHYCDTITQARDHAHQGHCVAVDLGVIRRADDLRPRMMVMGLMSPESSRREAELEKPDAVSAKRERQKEQARREAAERNEDGAPSAASGSGRKRKRLN